MPRRSKQKLAEYMEHYSFARINSYLNWFDDVNYLWNGGFEEDYETEEENGELRGYYHFLEEIGTEDCVIANAYRCIEQLGLLLLEKYGVIPSFSKNLSDNTPVIMFNDYNKHEKSEFLDAAFKSAFNKFGYSFPDKYNYSGCKGDGLSQDIEILSPKVQERLNKQFNDAYDAALEIIQNGEEPEKVEEIFKECDIRYIVTLSNEKLNRMFRRYMKLTPKRRARFRKVFEEVKQDYTYLLGDVIWDVEYQQETDSCDAGACEFMPTFYVDAVKFYDGNGQNEMVYSAKQIFQVTILPRMFLS